MEQSIVVKLVKKICNTFKDGVNYIMFVSEIFECIYGLLHMLQNLFYTLMFLKQHSQYLNGNAISFAINWRHLGLKSNYSFHVLELTSTFINIIEPDTFCSNSYIFKWSKILKPVTDVVFLLPRLLIKLIVNR